MSELDTAATEDWSARATTTIVGYVDTVRGATTGKALTASRLAVYFLAAGLAGIVALLLGLVLLVRLLVVATNNIPVLSDYASDGEVWMAYWILGLLFTLIGWVAWRKRGK
jgi:hypothetical protein